MQVKIEKLKPEELKKRGVFSWPIWEKEISRFQWNYDSIEECYFLEGKVTLELVSKETLEFGKGDFVTFPKGLSCTWSVLEPVRKHYNFR